MRESIRKIYEDERILAIAKPAGVLAHATKQGEEKTRTVVQWLLERYPYIAKTGDAGRPGIVHRLDKDTSGVMIVAKTADSFEYLKHLFKTRDIVKTYLVLAEGMLKPKKGRIEKPISIKKGTIKRTVFSGKNVKQALTDYAVLEYLDCGGKPFSLVRASPKTGRTHQIRIHFASIHHPVVCDALYGKAENPMGLTRQFLHAESLEFNLENGKRIKIESELPEDLASALARCGRISPESA